MYSMYSYRTNSGTAAMYSYRTNSGEEAWPPVWKPVEESPQFKHGLIQPYLRHWQLEDFDHIDDSKFPLARWGNIISWPVKDNHKNLKRFLQQVRESRGYDVDCVPPKFMNSPFFPASPDRLRNYSSMFKADEKIRFVVEEINAQAERHGKRERYEFVEVKHVVAAWAHGCTLLTFTVKEVPSMDNAAVQTVQAMVFKPHGRNQYYKLLEWRFKPPVLDVVATSSSDPSGGRTGDAIRLV